MKSLLIIHYFASILCAQEVKLDLSLRSINPFTGITSNTANAFWGVNGVLQLAALGITPLLVQSGADRETHNYLVNHQSFTPYSTPALAGAVLIPVALGGGLYTYGRMQNSSHEVAAGCAVAQATLLAFSYQTLLKSVTGRAGPRPREMTQDEVADFPFGFMRGGVFWGWPSGHMLTTTAIITSMQTMYPSNRGVQWGGYAYLTYAFASVLVHGKSSMHYLSDAVAGTLMGIAIGRSVGNGFNQKVNPATQTQVQPLLGKASGVQIQIPF